MGNLLNFLFFRLISMRKEKVLKIEIIIIFDTKKETSQYMCNKDVKFICMLFIIRGESKDKIRVRGDLH